MLSKFISGLAHRLTGLNAFAVGSRASGEHGSSAFLTCEGCGYASEVSSAELFETLSSLHKNRSFTPHTKVLELIGRCARC